MKPLQRPETTLYCTGCDYHEESWRFSAVGGDDVEYRCPKCQSVATLTNNQDKQEIPEMPIKPIVKQSTPVFHPNYIVADFEKATIQILSEADAASSDGDVLLPMLTADQLEKMPKHMARTWEQQLTALCSAIDEGMCPEHPEVAKWLTELFPAPAEVEEAQVFDMDTDGPLEEPEEMDGDVMDFYMRGFDAGVAFCMQQQLLDRALSVMSANRSQPVDHTPAAPISAERKQAILSKLAQTSAARKGK